MFVKSSFYLITLGYTLRIFFSGLIKLFVMFNLITYFDNVFPVAKKLSENIVFKNKI